MQRKLDAFSLIEIALVLIIMSILLSVSLPTLSFSSKLAQKQKCEANVDIVLKSLGGFVATHGFLPEPDNVQEDQGEFLIGTVPNALRLMTQLTHDDKNNPILYKVRKKLTQPNLRLNHPVISSDFCAGDHDFDAVTLKANQVEKRFTRNNFVAVYCHTVCKLKNHKDPTSQDNDD